MTTAPRRDDCPTREEILAMMGVEMEEGDVFRRDTLLCAAGGGE